MYFKSDSFSSSQVSTYPVKHANNVLGVTEDPYVQVILAVHNSHCLQAGAFHLWTGVDQQPVVQVVEEWSPINRKESLSIYNILVKI